MARRRLQTRFLGETYEEKTDPNFEINFVIEVTNLGDKPTALSPSIKILALHGRTATPIRVELSISESDRKLVPNSPTEVHASTVSVQNA